MRLSRNQFLLILAGLAFVVRFGLVLAVRGLHPSGPGREFGADGVEFDLLARRLAEGHGYTWQNGQPTAFRAPGFPFALAALYRVPGANCLSAYLLFCLIGSLTCVLTYSLAKQVLSERNARIAAFLGIVYIPHIYFSAVFSSETLFCACLAGGLALYLRYLDTERIQWLLPAGLLLGWGALTRPFGLLLLPMLVLVILGQQNYTGRWRLGPCLAFSLAFLAVIVPWSLRNYRVFHQTVLVATNGGSTFYGGNNDLVLHERARLGSWISTTELPGRLLIDAAPNEAIHDQVEWRLGKSWVGAHLRSMPTLLAFKMARLCLPDFDSRNRKYVLLQIVGATPYLLIAAFGFAQTLLSRRSRTFKWTALHLTVAATVIASLVFWGSPRFRDANMPVIMLYASCGVSFVTARVRQALRRSQNAFGAAALPRV